MFPSLDDPLWADQGPDRKANLIERSAFYVNFEIEMSKEWAKTGVWNPDAKPATKQETMEEKLERQGQRIVELEKLFEQKNQLISEQMKTIRQLHSQTK